MGLRQCVALYSEQLEDVIAGPLSTIFQRSLDSGEDTADWKLSNVISAQEETQETTDLLV